MITIERIDQLGLDKWKYVALFKARRSLTLAEVCRLRVPVSEIKKILVSCGSVPILRNISFQILKELDTKAFGELSYFVDNYPIRAAFNNICDKCGLSKPQLLKIFKECCLERAT